MPRAVPGAGGWQIPVERFVSNLFTFFYISEDFNNLGPSNTVSISI